MRTNSPQVMEDGKGAWPVSARIYRRDGWEGFVGSNEPTNSGMCKTVVCALVKSLIAHEDATHAHVRLSDGSLVVVRRKRNGH